MASRPASTGTDTTVGTPSLPVSDTQCGPASRTGATRPATPAGDGSRATSSGPTGSPAGQIPTRSRLTASPPRPLPTAKTATPDRASPNVRRRSPTPSW